MVDVKYKNNYNYSCKRRYCSLITGTKYLYENGMSPFFIIQKKKGEKNMKKHAKELAVEAEVRDCAAKNKIMFSQHSVKRMGERKIDSAALMKSLKKSELINVETRENAINDKEARYTLRCFVGDNIVDVVLAKNNWANDYPFVLVTTFMENKNVESLNGKPSPAKPYSWAKKKQAMASNFKYKNKYIDDDEYQLSCELALYD